MRFLFLLCFVLIIVGLVLYVLGCFDYSSANLKCGFLPRYAVFILLGGGMVASMICGLSLMVIFEAEIGFNILMLIVSLLCGGSFSYYSYSKQEQIEDTSTFVLLPIVFYLFTVVPAFFVFI